ncbi:MAG TPA: hypothetical protein VMM38_15155 [Aridibacter sp.]|nr:hypothetical protein [Aridibacter sp.]
MKIENRTGLDNKLIELLCSEISEHRSLKKVIEWASSQPKGHVLPHVVDDVILQDE